jgi:LDH2 family malate/lactate/ureidoglycolate dehydrogenase
LLIAMDIAHFQPLEAFTARMEAFVDEIKAVPLAKGFDEVFYPGEIEDHNDAQCRREGLALPEDTRDDLRRIAQATGLVAQCPC